MRIGRLAGIAGVSTRTIRHYHRVGLLAEPERESNGYRSYRIDDAVLLLRIRRLAELGLSLDEIGDALDDDERGRDLTEVLDELDADLRREQEAIAERRRRIAELRSTASRGPMSARVRGIAGRLSGVYAEHGTAARMELAMMEVLTETVPGATAMYEAALADDALVARYTELASAFDALRDASPDAPEVDRLAADIVTAAGGLVGGAGESAVDDPADPGGAARVAEADLADWFDADDEMTPAQRRCVARVMDLMRAASRPGERP